MFFFYWILDSIKDHFNQSPLELFRKQSTLIFLLSHREAKHWFKNISLPKGNFSSPISGLYWKAHDILSKVSSLEQSKLFFNSLRRHRDRHQQQHHVLFRKIVQKKLKNNTIFGSYFEWKIKIYILHRIYIQESNWVLLLQSLY